jgi:general stress protein CsbA
MFIRLNLFSLRSGLLIVTKQGRENHEFQLFVYLSTAPALYFKFTWSEVRVSMNLILQTITINVWVVLSLMLILTYYNLPSLVTNG